MAASGRTPANGCDGAGMSGEHRIALEMLSLLGGERVLDVACGTGSFTRSVARRRRRRGVSVWTRRGRCWRAQCRRPTPTMSSTCRGTPARCRSATAASMRSAASPRSGLIAGAAAGRRGSAGPGRGLLTGAGATTRPAGPRRGHVDARQRRYPHTPAQLRTDNGARTPTLVIP